MPKDIKMTNEERMALLNAKTEEVALNQEEQLVADYDAALEEFHRENKPFKVKFKGKVFNIPSSMPFSFGMFYMRHCVQKINGVTQFIIPEELIGEFIEKMFGPTFLAEIDDDTTELAFIMEKIIPDIMDKWGYSVSKNKVTEQGKNM